MLEESVQAMKVVTFANEIAYRMCSVLQEWKAFVSKCGGKFNFFVNNLKGMKFFYADHLVISRGYHNPKKLGRFIGVDMAWELGLLSAKPELEFSRRLGHYKTKMSKFSTQSIDNYQQFNKYQSLISESFDNVMSKKSKGMYVQCI